MYRTVKLLVLSILILSCQEDTPKPSAPEQFVKAKVNGEQFEFTTRSTRWATTLDSADLSIAFQKDCEEDIVWLIDIRGVDFYNADYPIVIQGPHDGGLDHPAFWCNIYDSEVPGKFGEIIAGTSTLIWNARVTLTSFEGGIIKGTFEGEGDEGVVFTEGSFAAKVK